jgi:hypothetical protein
MELALCPSKADVFRAMRAQNEVRYLKQEEDRDVERAMAELAVRDEKVRKERKEVAKMTKKAPRRRDMPYDIDCAYVPTTKTDPITASE